MFKFAVAHVFSELTLNKLASPAKSVVLPALPIAIFSYYFFSFFCQRLLSVENTPFRISLLSAGRKQMRFPSGSSIGYFRAISFPEPTCLLVSTKTLTKRHVGLWERD